MSDSERRTLQLHAYHDGELGRWARWRFERRLARDPDARAELAGLRSLGELLRESEDLAETPDLWSAIRPALPRRPEVSRAERDLGGWLPSWAPAGLAAAAVAVMLAVGLGGGDAPDPSSLRWLDTGGRSAAVLQDDGEATIIWILDADPSTGRGDGVVL